MWFFLAILVIVLALGGCAFVMGSGSATLRVQREVELGSSNTVDATKETHREVESKDKKQ